MAAVIIGMDPHKRSATIEVIDAGEKVLARTRFGTDSDGYKAMLAAGRRYPQRTWAVEDCNGIGRHVAQRLVAAVAEIPYRVVNKVRPDGGPMAQQHQARQGRVLLPCRWTTGAPSPASTTCARSPARSVTKRPGIPVAVASVCRRRVSRASALASRQSSLVRSCDHDWPRLAGWASSKLELHAAGGSVRGLTSWARPARSLPTAPSPRPSSTSATGRR